MTTGTQPAKSDHKRRAKILTAIGERLKALQAEVARERASLRAAADAVLAPEGTTKAGNSAVLDHVEKTVAAPDHKSFVQCEEYLRQAAEAMANGNLEAANQDYRNFEKCILGI